MSLEEDIRQLVLGLDGVAAVYSADPLWKNVARQVGALLGTGTEPPEVPFVDCSMEGGGDGAVMTVRLRIGTDGSAPAPATARAVAAAIRAHVSAVRPELGVAAAVEVSAIGV